MASMIETAKEVVKMANDIQVKQALHSGDLEIEAEVDNIDDIEVTLTEYTEEAQIVKLVDKSIMEAACASAKTGVALKHGGPFGAAVVRNGVYISLAHNTVLMDQDPTCHAEMNAIRYACIALQTHDLSDCVLYTTCEPCVMCLGACAWARLKKVYTGVDRYTAAQFGFDDKVFYDEVDALSGHWAISVGVTMPNIQPSMLNMYWGVEKERVESILRNPDLNRTYRHRMGRHKSVGFHNGGDRFGEDLRNQLGGKQVAETGDSEASDSDDPAELVEAHVQSHIDSDSTRKVFTVLEEAIKEACATGQNKEREVFASCIVDKDGEILSVAVNEVLKRNDATATSEVLAIRKAAKKLGTFCLEGTSIYSTVEPDIMSLGACLWARIGTLYYGVSQNGAARYGFEEGLLQYRELFANPEIIESVVDIERFVAVEECAEVFKQWQKINGIIY